jgi:D-2-hydroxyacid dehydrogenase (NADP+)
MTIAVWLTHPTVTAWRFQKHHYERLVAALPHATIHLCTCRDEMLEVLPQTTTAIVWGFKQEWFYLAPQLQRLATPAAGRDYFSVLPPDGVEQWYGSFHGPLIAETVLGMALGAHRGILSAAESMRNPQDDPWPREALEPLQRSLRGSHMAILGFGHIGEAIGQLAKSLDIRITAIRQSHLDKRPDYFNDSDRLISPADLPELLPTVDTLVCALPGGSRTDLLVGHPTLAKLPRHAVLINIGRGNAIDEEALTQLLNNGHLTAACLDVFHTEPLPETSPLRDTPRCYLMPHASAVTPNYLDLYLDELIPRLQAQN